MSATQIATAVSPYKAAQIVNTLLAEAGVEKILPPQMFYTYTKKGYIPATDGKISLEDLQVWFEKYLAKQVVSQPTLPFEV